jgi:beta-glucosidase
MKLISQPLDFFCVNSYAGSVVRAGANGSAEFIQPPVGWPITLNHWYMLPEALYWAPRFYYERYGKPVYITENGLSCMDWVALDGHVHDPQRIDFTQRYLLQVAISIRDGIDIRGYFHWSILDNFEWAVAYQQRFGIVHVDYTTQQRTPKDSFYFYQRIIKENQVVFD